MSPDPGPQIALEAPLAALLAEAGFYLGRLSLLRKVWTPWPGFAYWPLTARAALLETRDAGYEADFPTLLGLGALPSPSRPSRGLRMACGWILAKRDLEAGSQDKPIIPSQAAETFYRLDAPWLKRGTASGRPDLNLPGLGVWSLAPRLLQSGLPPLLVLAITLASWQHQGPDHPKRDPCGWLLGAVLGGRMGIIPQALEGMGAALAESAASEAGGRPGVLARLRASGGWREFAACFFRAVALNAGRLCELALKAQEMLIAHRELISTWVRAPRQPALLLDLLLKRPVLELPEIAREMEITQRTAAGLVTKLKELAVLEEITGQKRGRRFAYRPLLDLLLPPQEEK
ncbi:MAG: hypothetical protein LBJ14_06430 [Desulfarculales bacterium]|nr:hypothetical protein [Desulfarculales bacterium]